MRPRTALAKRQAALTNSRMDSEKRRARLKRAARWVVVLGVLYAMLRWFEHSQIYQPSREFEASPAELGRAFEEVRFQTSDGVALHGWFFPRTPTHARPIARS